MPAPDKKIPFISAIITAASILLAGCSSVPEETCIFSPDPVEPLRPFPYEETRDLDDSILSDSVQRLVNNIKGPAHSRFDYTRIDLDGDGNRDALVYMKAPYSRWCGQHGCTLFVMKAGLESFENISEVQPIRPPLIVSKNTTNGWKDIMVRVDGRWSKTKNVALQFNGHRYPSDPAKQPPVYKLVSVEGIRVFP